MLEVTKEILWHMTCGFCKMPWTYATMDDIDLNLQFFCPLCGEKQEASHSKTEKVLDKRS